MIFLRDYFRVLIPLFVAFTTYHVLFVPLVEPKTAKQNRHWNAPALPTHDDWWADSFQDGEWQRDKNKPPRVVMTETAILLFQECEQMSETLWLVKPLTILIPQRDVGSSKRAVQIRNNEGAEIQFESAVDWSKELPPIVGGQLRGEISIVSPAEDGVKNSGMQISTRDIRINKREIWTSQRVKAQLGNSIVEGSNLRIFLDKDLLANDQPGSRANSPFNGLEKIELTYVERVYLGLEPGGLLPRKDIPDIAQRPSHATLTCGGSFEFHFHLSQAKLKKGVHMEHIVQGLPVDTFDCNELQMQVGWQGKTPIGAIAGDAAGSNWKVERLEAVGVLGKDNRDHSGWLKLIAPGMQAEAYGQHLVMDMIDGLVTLSNRLPGVSSRELTPVYLKRENVQVWSQEVQYQSAAAIGNASGDTSKSNQGQKSNRLGVFIAQGAGRAQMDSKEDSWTLSWGERLLVRPDPNDVSFDLVDIKGSANISSPTQGRFRAEQLYLWLRPVTSELALRLAPDYPDGSVPQSLPDRIEADGKVVVDSPSLRATVEKMQVWFGYQRLVEAVSPTNNVTLPSSNAIASNAIAPNQLVAFADDQVVVGDPNRAPGLLNLLPPSTSQQLSAGGQNPSAVSQPLTVKQPVASSSPTQKAGLLSANPNAPAIVTARTMRAKVMRDGNQSRVEDLLLEGNFTLTKSQFSDDSPWPFVAIGDRMELSQSKNDGSDITIVGLPGQPAKVAVGSGWVKAPTLKLKQGENQFSIDHAGEMVVPIEAMQRREGSSAGSASLVSVPNVLNSALPNNGFSPARSITKENDSSVRWHEPPKLQWGSGMTFDGRIARFRGGVNLNCRMETDSKTLWHLDVSSGNMSIEMTEPISMRSNKNSSEPVPQPQIASIRFEDRVNIRGVQTDLNSRRRSMEHMQLPILEIQVPTQTWIGQGPGEIWSRRLGNGNPIGNVSSTAQSRSPIADRFAENTYQCIHLSFIGRMEGNMAQRRTTFYDRIEALIGPIPSWEDALNVHEVDRPGRNQSLLVSDQLSIFDASGLSHNQSPGRDHDAANNAAWELEATSLEGQSRVHMQSNTESGDISIHAHSLKYAAITDTARIEGSQRQPASISKLQPNSPQMDLHVINAAYRLKTGEVSGQISKFEGELPQNLQPGGKPPAGQPQLSPGAPGVPPRQPSLRDNPVKPSGRR